MLLLLVYIIIIIIIMLCARDFLNPAFYEKAYYYNVISISLYY